MAQQEDLFLPLLQRATDGDTEAARTFFELFLKTELVVLRRTQAHPLSNTPEYPNEFFDILGIASPSGEVSVPVFSSPELIEEWSGNALHHRSMTGSTLVSLMPEEWSITFNPGSDWGKEFSPWEISELRHGKTAIDEIMQEAFQEELCQPLLLEPPKAQEHLALVEVIQREAHGFKEVLRAWVLVSSEEQRLSVGILVGRQEAVPLVQEHFERVCQLHLIGAEPARVFAGAGQGTKQLPLNLGQFEPFSPCYEQKETPSFLERFRKLIGF